MRNTLWKRTVSLLIAVLMLMGIAEPALALTIAFVTTESQFKAGTLEDAPADGSYSVRISYNEDAGIPEGARIVSSEVTEAEAYRAAVENRLKAGQTAVMSRFFDIDIVDEAGESVNLLAPVEVVIEVFNAPEESTGVSVFHFEGSPAAPEAPAAEGQEDAAVPEVSGEDGDFTVPSKDGAELAEEGLAAPEMLRGMKSAVLDAPLAEADLPAEDEVLSVEDEVLPVEDIVLPEDASLPEDIAVERGTDSAVIEEVRVTGNEGGKVTFLAGGFSVYGVVYTVDFSYSVNGQTFEFSLPGGSGIGLSELLPLLGVAADNPETEDDEVQRFADQIENVEFSNPELVWVGKVESDTTVGELKAVNALACEYSAELTEEQIAEMDARTIKAGDWALISLKAFESEENLTVTMKNGEQFVVMVTDGQITDASTLEEGERYVLYIVYNRSYYALDSNGNTVQVPNNDLDNLGSEYLWTYDFMPMSEGQSQSADGCSWANGSNYLDVYWSYEDRWYQDKYNPVAPASGGWVPIEKLVPAGDGGFYFSDVNDDTRFLYLDRGNNLHIRTCHASAHQAFYQTVPNPVSVHIYKQDTTYTVTCKTDNAENGNVRYVNNGSTQQTNAYAPTFNITTVKNDTVNKQVPGTITAVPAEGYKFTSWTVINEDENEYTVIDWGEGCTSESVTITPTVNGNLTLQANFAPERQFTFTVQTNDPDMGTVGGSDSTGTEMTNQGSFQSISTAVINGAGLNTYAFTATKKPLHKFLRWELRDANGDLVSEYTTPNIDAKSIQLTEDGMTLTAIFAKKTETEINNDDIDALLDNWQNSLTGDFVGVDKTAHVYDYDNRIYEIDLTASSGKWATERSITLDFITDTSRSMYFPANLEFATGSEGTSTFSSLSWWLSNKSHSDVYYVISNDNSATMYAVFYDNGWKYIDSSYKFYEKAGSSSPSPQAVPDGLNVTGGKILTGKIYKSSVPPTTYNGTPSAKYWSRLDYLYKAVAIATETVYTIDPSSSISLTTFNAKSERKGTLGTTEDSVYATLGSITPAGGTRQDRGLLTSYNGWNYNGDNATSNSATTSGRGEYVGSAFSQDSQNKQFAILVSDGAPNFGTYNPNNLSWNDIFTQANLLKGIRDAKGENLTLMTLGLSLDFVNPIEQQNFNNLASAPKYAENADNGGEIVNAIKDLVESMVKKADLFGTVSDRLDPAFYPVDENGDPISAGYYKNGQPYTPVNNDSSEYYGWTKDGDVWTITYYNQTFKWPEMDDAGNITENGWEQSLFVKTKEDFLGGNTIETNKPNATDNGTVFTATHTILLDDNGNELPATKKEVKDKDNNSAPVVKNDIPTPHVNIKQLTLDSNDTKWTVYTESTVYPPIDQIKELFNIIKVSEVVSASTNNMITSNADMLFEPGEGGNPETFLLKNAIKVSAADWDDLAGREGGDGTVDIPYTAYEHVPGVIRLTLTKEGDNADYAEHATSSSPNAVEKYVLTAQYVPYTVEEMQAKDADGGEYHTTSEKDPGTVQQNGGRSVNTHEIDLFTRGISITKTDESFATGIPGAEFMVYRPATTEETESDDPEIKAKLKTFEGDSGTYFADHALEFDENGIAYKNGVKAYGKATKYYLVETKAPYGYDLLEDPIPVELTITDSYTLMPVAEGATPVTQETKPAGLFNWEQKATLQLAGDPDDLGYIRTTAAYDPEDETTDLTDAEIEATSLYEVMYYRVKNKPLGYLQVNKIVTYNNDTPTSEELVSLEGEYTFGVYTDQGCEHPYEENGTQVTLSVTISGNAEASSSVIPLPEGTYWIKEMSEPGTGILPNENPLEITITEDNTNSSPASVTFTNNKNVDDNKDKMAIELEKQFTGLVDKTHIPSGFKVVLSYKVGTSTRTIDLTNADQGNVGTDNVNIDWSESEDGFTWHWRITNLPYETSDFKVSEANYDNPQGYDWIGTTLNGNSVADPSQESSQEVLQPTITFESVNEREINPDNDKTFLFNEDMIWLLRATSHEGVVVISVHTLSYATRLAVEDYIHTHAFPQAQWGNLAVSYYSEEAHPDGFSVHGHKLKLEKLNPAQGKYNYVLTVDKNQSNHNYFYELIFDQHSDANSFKYVNNYQEYTIAIDIIKEDIDTGEKLPGAVFVLRQIRDAEPGQGGAFATEDGTTPKESEPTANTTGLTTFTGLTHGFYELVEKRAPEGYILTGESVTYFKIERGVVTWLVKGEGKPSTWSEKTVKGEGELVDFTAAVEAVANDPDTPEDETVAAENAKFIVENKAGVSLPSTGANPPIPFVALGTVLTVSATAGILLELRRRRREAE